MPRVKLLTLLSVLVAGACTHADPVPELNLTKPLAAVRAKYITERSHEAGSSAQLHPDGNHAGITYNAWLFSRNANRIEVTNPAQQVGEAWLRDGKTDFYQKIFHSDRKIVEYQQEDLSALNVPVNWETNALMIDPRVLEQLQVRSARRIDGHPALVLAGKEGSVNYDVVWLTDLNIPYRLHKRDRFGEEETTSLAALLDVANANQYAPAADGYEVIDYADLGDRERDPFVARIQQQLPGEHTHTH